MIQKSLIIDKTYCKIREDGNNRFSNFFLEVRIRNDAEWMMEI
jgi:hypothetical protein